MALLIISFLNTLLLCRCRFWSFWDVEGNEVQGVLCREAPGPTMLDTRMGDEGPSPASGEQGLSVLSPVKTKVSSVRPFFLQVFSSCWKKKQKMNGSVYLDFEYLKFISLSFPGLSLSFKVKMFRMTFLHVTLLFSLVWDVSRSPGDQTENLGLKFSLFFCSHKTLSVQLRPVLCLRKVASVQMSCYVSFPNIIEQLEVPKTGKSHAPLTSPIPCSSRTDL